MKIVMIAKEMFFEMRDEEAGNIEVSVLKLGFAKRGEQLLYRYTLLLLANDIPQFHPITKTSLSARRLKLLVNIMARYLRLNRIKD